MSTAFPQRHAHVFLTGVTGFVGKVVLEELIRRHAELQIERVFVLIRPGKRRDGTPQTPTERFREGVARAEAFKHLPTGWVNLVEVVAGDLEQMSCGLSEADLQQVRGSVTHVIHCAASVDFDLPVQEAAAANITSALGVLELARSCRKLVGMVDVSTAYVSPWRPGPIRERLAHLPRPAEDLYTAILNGTRPEAELLAETGHPNTYTYTKCIAEHLLCQRRGKVPLSIVRPSIISASYAYPFPGWIDSNAALAGCLLAASLGTVEALNAHPSTRLDVVPVDIVSHRIVESAFHQPFALPGGEVPIRYAAMGIEKALNIAATAVIGRNYFQVRPGVFRNNDMFLGTESHGQIARDTFQRTLPHALTRAFFQLTGNRKDLSRLNKLDSKITYLAKAFKYFTYHTFDFQPSIAPEVPNYTPAGYTELICRGMYKHLLKKDDTEVTLAGRIHKDAKDDLSWMLEKPDGNWAIRTLGIGLRKVLRQATDAVTFDRRSFEEAVAKAPPDALFILAPSHRSYFDFLLSSYLLFQHPELNIPIPHIAAADDFSKIPVVGNILKEARAFYIPRGVGKEVPEVNEQLRQVAEKKGSLMFFVEGQRSRARRQLAPKRGLIRGLQATGRTFCMLPIAISYDRVPEEGAFEKELTGVGKPKMSVQAILKWLGSLSQGDVHLGRVHIACGEPQILHPDADVYALSERLVGEQQRCTAATRFHLRAFLAQANLPADVTLEWLAEAIEDRGGRVLDSDLPLPTDLPPALDQSLRNQWMHWFFGDALALYPENPVVADHVARHGWLPTPAREDSEDPRVAQVVQALFTPILRDHARTLQVLGAPSGAVTATPASVLQAWPDAHLPTVEDAFQLLADSKVLVKREDKTFAWGPATATLAAVETACKPALALA